MTIWITKGNRAETSAEQAKSLAAAAAERDRRMANERYAAATNTTLAVDRALADGLYSPELPELPGLSDVWDRSPTTGDRGASFPGDDFDLPAYYVPTPDGPYTEPTVSDGLLLTGNTQFAAWTVAHDAWSAADVDRFDDLINHVVAITPSHPSNIANGAESYGTNESPMVVTTHILTDGSTAVSTHNLATGEYLYEVNPNVGEEALTEKESEVVPREDVNIVSGTGVDIWTEQTISELERSGLIVKDEDGKYRLVADRPWHSWAVPTPSFVVNPFIHTPERNNHFDTRSPFDPLGFGGYIGTINPAGTPPNATVPGVPAVAGPSASTRPLPDPEPTVWNSWFGSRPTRDPLFYVAAGRAYALFDVKAMLDLRESHPGGALIVGSDEFERFWTQKPEDAVKLMEEHVRRMNSRWRSDFPNTDSYIDLFVPTPYEVRDLRFDGTSWQREANGVTTPKSMEPRAIERIQKAILRDIRDSLAKLRAGKEETVQWATDIENNKVPDAIAAKHKVSVDNVDEARWTAANVIAGNAKLIRAAASSLEAFIVDRLKQVDPLENPQNWHDDTLIILAVLSELDNLVYEVEEIDRKMQAALREGLGSEEAEEFTAWLHTYAGAEYISQADSDASSFDHSASRERRALDDWAGFFVETGDFWRGGSEKSPMKGPTISRPLSDSFQLAILAATQGEDYLREHYSISGQRNVEFDIESTQDGPRAWNRAGRRAFASQLRTGGSNPQTRFVDARNRQGKASGGLDVVTAALAGNTEFWRGHTFTIYHFKVGDKRYFQIFEDNGEDTPRALPFAEARFKILRWTGIDMSGFGQGDYYEAMRQLDE